MSWQPVLHSYDFKSPDVLSLKRRILEYIQKYKESEFVKFGDIKFHQNKVYNIEEYIQYNESIEIQLVEKSIKFLNLMDSILKKDRSKYNYESHISLENLWESEQEKDQIFVFFYYIVASILEEDWQAIQFQNFLFEENKNLTQIKLFECRP